MGSGFCDTCGRYTLNPRNHTCPPKWHVARTDRATPKIDTDGVWETVYANASEEAAREFASHMQAQGWQPEELDLAVHRAGDPDDERVRLVITPEWVVNWQVVVGPETIDAPNGQDATP